MRIEIDRTKCSGMGLCEIAAPDIFEVGEDGQAHVLREPSGADTPLLEDAVSACPTRALTLYPDD